MLKSLCEMLNKHYTKEDFQMKKLTSRFISCLLVVMMLTSLMVLSVAAESKTASLIETPANGDKVVIYYPDSSKALGNVLENNKISAIDATLTDGKLDVSDDMGVFTVTKDEAKNAFYFVDANGKYVTSGATGNSMSLEDAASDLALWTFEAAEGGCYIKNYAAAYVSGETSKPQYLEFYKGFTTYSFNASKANIYTFAFYKIDDTTPPVEEVVYSTISEARLGEKNAVFNVKGVVTFIDGKNVVVEDETGAINLYLKAAAEVSVGNKIAAKGKRGAFNGLQQLTSAEVLEVLEESAAIPSAKEVTLADILADAEAETMECHFVVIKNVTLGETDAEKSTTAITDDAGNTINIYRCPELEIAVGTKVDVVALVSDYKGYQLRVTDASAITAVESDVTDEPSDDPSAPAKPGDASNMAFFAIIALISMTALLALTKREA